MLPSSAMAAQSPCTKRFIPASKLGSLAVHTRFIKRLSQLLPQSAHPPIVMRRRVSPSRRPRAPTLLASDRSTRRSGVLAAMVAARVRNRGEDAAPTRTSTSKPAQTVAPGTQPRHRAVAFHLHAAQGRRHYWRVIGSTRRSGVLAAMPWWPREYEIAARTPLPQGRRCGSGG